MVAQSKNKPRDTGDLGLIAISQMPGEIELPPAAAGGREPLMLQARAIEARGGPAGA